MCLAWVFLKYMVYVMFLRWLAGRFAFQFSIRTARAWWWRLLFSVFLFGKFPEFGSTVYILSGFYILTGQSLVMMEGVSLKEALS